jgi:hypothetical protein
VGSRSSSVLTDSPSVSGIPDYYRPPPSIAELWNPHGEPSAPPYRTLAIHALSDLLSIAEFWSHGFAEHP